MIRFLLFFLLLTINTIAKAEVTYTEILKKPTDLKLNLRYAKEQESLGEYKNVIATLERLTALYPENIDLKLYYYQLQLRQIVQRKYSG